jgi:hypothetical protein
MKQETGWRALRTSAPCTMSDTPARRATIRSNRSRSPGTSPPSPPPTATARRAARLPASATEAISF